MSEDKLINELKLEKNIKKNLITPPEKQTPYAKDAMKLGVNGVENIEVERPPVEIPEKNRKLLEKDMKERELRAKQYEKAKAEAKKAEIINLDGETRTKTELEYLAEECGIERDIMGLKAVSKALRKMGTVIARRWNWFRNSMKRKKEIKTFDKTLFSASRSKVEPITKDKVIAKQMRRDKEDIMKGIPPMNVSIDENFITDIEKNVKELNVKGVENIKVDQSAIPVDSVSHYVHTKTQDAEKNMKMHVDAVKKMENKLKSKES